MYIANAAETGMGLLGMFSSFVGPRMPVSQDDFGKKGWRGAGETRVAIEEWYQVRAIDNWPALQEFF